MDSDLLKIELDSINKFNVNVLDITQPDYPSLLQEIYNAPPILYMKGNINLRNGFYLAMVGSRKASFAGKRMCERLVRNIADLNPNTVIVPRA